MYIKHGKQLDMMHGLNTYDYGARQYAPTLGRWDRMDPLCEKYYSVSPYAYCGNNPVRLRDRAGMEPGDAFESLDEAALNFCSIFGENGGYPPTKNGDIRSLLCA